MKTLVRFFIVACLIQWTPIVLPAQQDASLHGQISIQNSYRKTGKREPVPGASVSAPGAVPKNTDDNGAFRLVFSDIPIGAPVRLSVKSEGLEVVNKKDIAEAALVGRVPALKVYMCKAGELDARIAEYYDFSVEAYTKGYREKTAALNKQIDQLEKEVQQGQKREADLRALRDAYTLLEEQYKKALEDANKLAEQFALVNLDDESDLYVAALDTFLHGYVREAIALLEGVNLEKRLADNAANVQKGEKIIEAAQAAVTQSKQQIEEDIRAAVLLARMYATQFEVDKAAGYYELAIRYDSTNWDNIDQYATFLQESKRYDNALNWLQKLAAARGVSADRRATALGQMGEIYQETGKFPQAMQTYHFYSSAFDSLYRDNPKSESLKNGLAISYEKLGDIYQAQGNFDTALVYFVKDLNLTEELYRDNPKSESLKNGLAISYSKLGSIYQAQGNFDTALVYFVRRSQLGEELYRDNPRNTELWFGLGISYYKLGLVHEALDDEEKTIDYFSRAAAIFRDMHRVIGLEKYKNMYQYLETQIQRLQSPSNPVIDRITTLEKQIQRTDNYTEKVQLQKQLLELLQSLLANNPENKDLRVYTAGAQGSLAWYLLFTNAFKEAESSARQALDLAPQEAEWVYSNLALALLHQGRYKDAEAIFRRFKGKPYDEERSWTEVFLADFEEMEQAGIRHKDVERIKKMLKQ
jgi:tetratricopeptide (TPR) repeat protein